jgi:protein-S-isoprenylcysteine O-methyltransferase Ste14
MDDIFRRETAARFVPRDHEAKEPPMMMILILLALLVFVFVALLPMWDYNAQWGYVPSGGAGLLVLIITLLLIAGRLG